MSRLNKTRGFGIIVAIALIVYGVYALWNRYQVVYKPSVALPDTVINQSIDEPGESKIDTQTTPYSVPGSMPRRIGMPSIAAEGFIQKVGVIAKTRKMAAPSNIHLAGWYTKSAKPGESGLSIIDGHVQGRYEDGLFKRLGNLKPGARLWVEYGDKSRRNFQVVSTTSYSVKAAGQALFRKSPEIKGQLNLITCGGSYNKSTKEYSHRIIVVARAI